jgi:hypothetical protein
LQQLLKERRYERLSDRIISGSPRKHADAPHTFALLRVRGERPPESRATECGYKFPPSDADYHLPVAPPLRDHASKQ